MSDRRPCLVVDAEATDGKVALATNTSARAKSTLRHSRVRWLCRDSIMAWLAIQYRDPSVVGKEEKMDGEKMLSSFRGLVVGVEAGVTSS